MEQSTLPFMHVIENGLEVYGLLIPEEIEYF